MSFWFSRLARKSKNGFLVLRIGKKEIDFVFFKKQNAESTGEILRWGSEDISRFTIRQVLEKIFEQLPAKDSVGELVVTFSANEFRAFATRKILAPRFPSHRIDKAEAFVIEKNIRRQAIRSLGKSLFEHSGILPNVFVLRRIQILEWNMNGYPVSKLEGLKRGEIACSLLGMFLLESSFAPVKAFARTHAISRVRVVHIAEALKAFTERKHREGIYLCVEEEKTQLALHTRNRFVFLGSIPLGEEHFFTFFGNAFGMREDTAEVFQEQYFQNDLSLATKEKVQHVLLPEVRKFGILVKAKLLEAKIPLPPSLWIFGRGDSLGSLQDILSEDLHEELPFSQEPQMNFLLPKDVWEIKNIEEIANPLFTELCFLGAFALESP